VNVGGTGKLPMSELKKICGQAGFDRIETYIARGNAVFESAASPQAVKAELATRLRSYAGKKWGSSSAPQQRWPGFSRPIR